MNQQKKRKSVCFLVTNDIKYDYRVLKEAKTVAKKYDVTILAFQSERTKIKEQKDNYAIHRVKEPLIRRIIVKITPLRSFFTNSSKIQASTIKQFQELKNNKNSNDNNKNNTKINKKLYLSDLGLYSYFIAKSLKLYKAAVKQNYKADIYHANDLDTLLAGYLLSRKYNAKLVYDSHELYTEIQSFVKTPFFKKLTAKFEASLIKKCNAIITVNDEIAEELEHRYKLKRKPFVIMNCPEKIKNDKNLATPVTRFLKNDNSIKIIYQGVLAAGRGLEELILSMKYLEGFTLYIQGFGVEKNNLIALAKHHNLQHKIIFLNPIVPEKTITIAKQADIGIVPYKNDCLNYYYLSPNKFFQYMMAGIAIVSSNSKVLSRIIEQNKIGLIINDYTPKNIAKTFEKLKDKKKLQQYKNNAKKLSEKYNWDIEGKKLLKIYSGLKK